MFNMKKFVVECVLKEGKKPKIMTSRKVMQFAEKKNFRIEYRGRSYSSQGFNQPPWKPGTKGYIVKPPRSASQTDVRKYQWKMIGKDEFEVTEL